MKVKYNTVGDKFVNKIIVVFKPFGIDGTPSIWTDAYRKLGRSLFIVQC